VEIAPRSDDTGPAGNALGLFESERDSKSGLEDDEDSSGSGNFSQNGDSDDPFHFSLGSDPEISFARGPTFPGLHADSKSASRNPSASVTDSDDESVGTGTGTSVVTRRAPAKQPLTFQPPEEILYIQMVSLLSLRAFFAFLVFSRNMLRGRHSGRYRHAPTVGDPPCANVWFVGYRRRYI
jgi:hypothetical protein